MTIGDRDIKSLKVRCENFLCPWVGELGQFNVHLFFCDFVLCSCSNECRDDSDKIVQIRRKDLYTHERKECPRRQYECHHCKEAGEYQERTTTHLDKCPKVVVRCPNRNCFNKVPRCELAEHRATCAHESVPCKYANIGCKEPVLRKDLTKHESDSQCHLQMVIDAVNLLVTRCVQNVVPVSKTEESELTQTTFKFENFLQHKTTKNDTVYSPHFYSSPVGYKMCIRVDADGNGDGKGTHVSVLVYLMRGENDDHLSWPFTGTVTVELLNQLEDKNHHSMSILFTSDCEEGQRVTDHEMAPKGYGCQQYISHSSLGHDAIKNCQFLKDDCLYFRFKVSQIVNPKPWLVISGNFTSRNE